MRVSLGLHGHTCERWQMPSARGRFLLLCHPAIGQGCAEEQRAERDLHTRGSKHCVIADWLQGPGSFHHPGRLDLRHGTVRNSRERWRAPETSAVNPEMGDCPSNVGQVLLLVTEVSLSAQ